MTCPDDTQFNTRYWPRNEAVGTESMLCTPSATNNTIPYHAENNMRIGWIESRIVKAVTETGPAYFVRIPDCEAVDR